MATGVAPQASFSPCNGLRRRFEYYLLGLGEVTVADIRTSDQRRSPSPNGEEFIAIGHLGQVLEPAPTSSTNAFVQSDRNTWMPAFEEQRMVRQIMGEEGTCLLR